MDATLWHAWRRGRNQDAFRAMVQPAMGFAYDFAHRLGCDGADADDAVQECLIQLSRERSDEPLRVGLHAWFGRRLRFGIAKQRRGRSRRRRRERASARRESLRSDEAGDRRDEIEAALAQLDAEERQLVLLRFLHDLDHVEIAYILNISPNACRIRVHRAVGRLRKRLGTRATLIVAALVPHRAARAEAILKAASSKAATGALIMSTGTKLVATGLAASVLTLLTLFATGVASFDEPPAQRTSTRRHDGPGELAETTFSPAAAPKGDAAARFAPGTCVLRIGDRYRFGDDRTGADDADLVCFDIREGTVLATPHGGTLAQLPLLGGKEAPAVDAAYDALASAPAEIRGERVHLNTQATQTHSGVALVKAGDGRSLKVVIVSIEEHPDARRRSVTLRYAAVPASVEGGVVHLREAVAVGRLPDGWLDTIRRLVEMPPAFREEADWVAVREVGLVEGLPPEFSIGPERQIALKGPLAGQLAITGPNIYSRDNPLGPALVYASRGVASGSKLVGGSWSVLLVEGDLEGEIETRTFSFVRVTGNVTGTLHLRSLGHVIVDGTILGELNARSSVHVLLRGTITKPEAIGVRSNATLYLEQPVTRELLERMSIRSRATIHVQHADLAPGEHELGRAKVIVGDPIWGELQAR